MSNELQELGKWKVGQEVIDTYNSFTGKVSRLTDGRGGTVYVAVPQTLGAGTYEVAFDINGKKRGTDTWSRSQLEVLTPDMKLGLERRGRRRKLAMFDWSGLPFDQSDAIVTFMRDKGIKI